MDKVRGYRLEIKLNNIQKTLCLKSIGISRFAYNWKLYNLNKAYEEAKKIAEANGTKVSCKLGSAIDWHKEWVVLKEEKPWIREVSKCCGQFALRELQAAFQGFFDKRTNYPKFKKKGQKNSFKLDGAAYITSTHIQLPNIGLAKLKEGGYPNIVGKHKLSSVVVSKQADRWFVSFMMNEGDIDQLPAEIMTIGYNDILGIDLGIKDLAITSDGEVFSNPKAYKKYQKKLAFLQRRASRKVKDSNNRKKANLKVARLHKKIIDIHTDAIHKMTSSLVKTKPKVIVIEDLKVKNMSKNHSLASSIADAAFGKIRQTLTYKCKWAGIHLIVAPAFYASSKLCSTCGAKHKNLQLKDREWACSNCGSEHDRDINAARNLQHLGAFVVGLPTTTTGSSLGSNACGDERLQLLTEQCSSMKQEFCNRSYALHNPA